MPKILIIYSSSEGQTQKVAHHMADVFSRDGHVVQVTSIAKAPSLTAFDAIVIGASIHMGRYKGEVKRTITENLTALQSRPSAFFTVCITAADPDEAKRCEAEAYSQQLLAETNWQPDAVATFAGAVRFQQLNFFMRFLMKRIVRESLGELDTSRNYEYTDWSNVEAFAQGFAQLVDMSVQHVGNLATERTDTP